jgi:hypothetical protein
MKKNIAIRTIGDLKGIVSIKKIKDTLLNIENFQTETTNKLKILNDYNKDEGILIDNLYVDLTYQRKLKVVKLINKLKMAGGFDCEVAGHVDVAVRTGGEHFVWDGFHRVLMAAIVGKEKIPASIFKHDSNSSQEDQLRKEAKMFKIRNADSETMKREEIFKSQIVFRDKFALEQLELLKKCKLDVEGVNEDIDAYTLGGLAYFQKQYDNIGHEYFVQSSEIIRTAYSKPRGHTDKKMSVILLCGLAKLLEANDSVESVTTQSVKHIETKFLDVSKNVMQKEFTQPRIHGHAAEWTARNILRRGLHELYNDDGNEIKSLLHFIEVDEDELEL